MVAKNNETHEFLARQIKDKTAIKKYLAIVKGSVKLKWRHWLRKALFTTVQTTEP